MKLYAKSGSRAAKNEIARGEPSISQQQEGFSSHEFFQKLSALSTFSQASNSNNIAFEMPAQIGGMAMALGHGTRDAGSRMEKAFQREVGRHRRPPADEVSPMGAACRHVA